MPITKDDKKAGSKKKTYKKPEIKRVNLDSTVLLARGCKFSTASRGKHGYSCNAQGSCKASGSGS